MAGKASGKNIMKFPERKQELTEKDVAALSIAYMQAMCDIADSLQTIELYIVRKGKKEGLFTEEEFEEGRGDE